MTDMPDHHRVSAQGRAIGDAMARTAQHGRTRLQAQCLAGINLPGMRDDMCPACACRPGTVPNGCLQTQLDLLKAVVQGDPFLCHAPKDGRMCAGWVAARAEHVARPLPKQAVELAEAWEYSPPDADDESDEDQQTGDASDGCSEPIGGE